MLKIVKSFDNRDFEIIHLHKAFNSVNEIDKYSVSYLRSSLEIIKGSLSSYGYYNTGVYGIPTYMLVDMDKDHNYIDKEFYNECKSIYRNQKINDIITKTT
jgi:hypothetical protein